MAIICHIYFQEDDTMNNNKWWKEAFGYQIYIRSFYDANNDGIGDLKGITEKLPYLSYLGVNLIWICPFYKSPMDDNGYDVADFYAVDETYGTLEDFRELIAEAHKRGIRVIIDLILNHTSDEHPWFIESRKSKDSPYRNYYIWQPPRYDESGNRKEPTNWASFFGGGCWEYDETTDEYYMKIFSKKMPDLNWENLQVQAEMVKVAKYWLDLGVDGFRVDAVAHLAKAPFVDSTMPTDYQYTPDWGKFSNLPKLHEYLKMMRKEAFSGYDLLVVGEVGGSALIEDALKYAAPEERELDMVFNFDHNWCNNSWSAKDRSELKINVPHLKEMFGKWQSGLYGKAWNALYWLNHDQPRVVTHYGDDEGPLHDRSAKALAVALYFMWGTPFIYNGEEIGMTNPHFKTIDDFKDVSFITQYYINVQNGADPEKYIAHASLSTRDNARTLMQWNDSLHGGFTKGTPWNLINDNYRTINVESQMKDPDSVLNFYRKVIEIRTKSAFRNIIIYGSYEPFLKEHPKVYAYLRRYEGRTMLIICNLTKEKAIVEGLPFTLIEKVLGTMNKQININQRMVLEPYEAYVLEIKEEI
jgi:glycosidase